MTSPTRTPIEEQERPASVPTPRFKTPEPLELANAVELLKLGVTPPREALKPTAVKATLVAPPPSPRSPSIPSTIKKAGPATLTTQITATIPVNPRDDMTIAGEIVSDDKEDDTGSGHDSLELSPDDRTSRFVVTPVTPESDVSREAEKKDDDDFADEYIGIADSIVGEEEALPPRLLAADDEPARLSEDSSIREEDIDNFNRYGYDSEDDVVIITLPQQIEQLPSAGTRRRPLSTTDELKEELELVRETKNARKAKKKLPKRKLTREERLKKIKLRLRRAAKNRVDSETPPLASLILARRKIEGFMHIPYGEDMAISPKRTKTDAESQYRRRPRSRAEAVELRRTKTEIAMDCGE